MYQHFGGTYSLHIHSFTLKMEAASFSDIMALIFTNISVCVGNRSPGVQPADDHFNFGAVSARFV
jgi:hypothetical protein